MERSAARSRKAFLILYRGFIDLCIISLSWFCLDLSHGSGHKTRGGKERLPVLKWLHTRGTGFAAEIFRLVSHTF